MMTMTREEFDVLCNTPAGNNTDGHGDWNFWQWVMQDQREFWALVEEVSKVDAKNILEIGSSHGGGLIFWDRLVGPDGKVASIDNNRVHRWTMDYSSCVSQMGFFYRDSHEEGVVEEVRVFFGEPIDFLFIDGDHSYEGAKMDYERFSPLVRAGGLVAFHDISYDSEIQVDRFFRTIARPKKRIEFSHGIGIVYL